MDLNPYILVVTVELSLNVPDEHDVPVDDWCDAAMTTVSDALNTVEWLDVPVDEDGPYITARLTRNGQTIV